jgi:predicted unusual protein kinase regulating ubiquinone biosynthesis (AarF/ABC1/UbiB family)
VSEHAPASDAVGPAPARWRLPYAYAVTARVLLSYLGVQLVGKVRGRAWREQALLRCHLRNARRVRHAILRLQGLFVKVGQLVSMLTSFLPGELREELAGLQDQVPPRPWEQVEARLREELGRPPDELFASLDRQALASASLAQVHAAVLPDGRCVAVKAQHLGIEELARRDLLVVGRILRLVGAVVGVRGLAGVHRDLQAMIGEELDFAAEARHLEEIAGAFAEDPTVRFPTVVAELSRRRVLTTTLLSGIKVSRREELAAAGFEREEVAATVLQAYCRMIFEHGVYHADPHPGNLFVLGGGAAPAPSPAGEASPPGIDPTGAATATSPRVVIGFVDFGAVGRLSPAMREGIPELFEGILASDPRRIVTAMRRIGFVAREGDERAAERVVSYLHRRFLEQVTLESWNLSEVRFDTRMKLETLGDLRRLGVSLRDLTSLFEVPRDWVLLERTLLLLLGLCTHLAPEMNPLQTVRPYLERLVLGRDRDWATVVGHTLRDLALAAVTLPGEMRRSLARLERGELEVQVDGLRAGLERLHAGLHQLLWGLLALGGGAIAYAARAAGDGAATTAAGLVAGGATAALLLSLWRHRRRR